MGCGREPAMPLASCQGVELGSSSAANLEKCLTVVNLMDLYGPVRPSISLGGLMSELCTEDSDQVGETTKLKRAGRYH